MCKYVNIFLEQDLNSRNIERGTIENPQIWQPSLGEFLRILENIKLLCCFSEMLLKLNLLP